MYDKGNGGSRLKNNVIVTLGWWHTYKIASYTVYKKFSKSFFAGCYHSLFPSKPFREHPQYLSLVIEQLSYVRLAYPFFKDQLQEALDSDHLLDHSKIELMNLQSLCEFFIPTVRVR